MARTKKTNINKLRKHNSLQKSKRQSRKAKKEKTVFAKGIGKSHIPTAKSVKIVLDKCQSDAKKRSDFY